ncbi:jg21720 [Pararge aegeria aegeria]|uniref:Jg21720 protein n=1 Tax=Pararge aegeria aegeria TaxID=348720 RepID=A0A8S4SBC1_9NEOP|nr:jg21720 [Pararge aegeria aegeria]
MTIGDAMALCKLQAFHGCVTRSENEESSKLNLIAKFIKLVLILGVRVANFRENPSPNKWRAVFHARVFEGFGSKEAAVDYRSRYTFLG